MEGFISRSNTLPPSVIIFIDSRTLSALGFKSKPSLFKEGVSFVVFTNSPEKITRIFFSHRRKMLKKPFNQIFNGNTYLLDKFNLDLSLRPQNLDFETYYKLTIEYEKLRS